MRINREKALTPLQRLSIILEEEIPLAESNTYINPGHEFTSEDVNKAIKIVNYVNRRAAPEGSVFWARVHQVFEGAWLEACKRETPPEAKKETKIKRKVVKAAPDLPRPNPFEIQLPNEEAIPAIRDMRGAAFQYVNWNPNPPGARIEDHEWDMLNNRIVNNNPEEGI